MINYYSTLEFKGFRHAPERPFADHFGCFNSKRIQVVYNDLKGFSLIEEEIPWYIVALKVTLFFLEVILVIPAIIFEYQKGSYRDEAHLFLNSKDWGKMPQNADRVNKHLFNNLIPKPFNQWTEEDYQCFINCIAKTPIESNEGIILDYLHCINSEKDSFSIKSGEYILQINKLAACRKSEFFNKALSTGMKESFENSISTYQSYQQSHHGAPYSKETMNCIANYLNTGRLFKRSDHSFRQTEYLIEAYKFAHQYLLDDNIFSQIRYELVRSVSDKPRIENTSTLLDIWCFAREFNDSGLMLYCAVARFHWWYSFTNFNNYKPQTESKEELEVLVEELEILREMANLVKRLEVKFYYEKLHLRDTVKNKEDIETLISYFPEREKIFELFIEVG